MVGKTRCPPPRGRVRVGETANDSSPLPEGEGANLKQVENFQAKA